MLIHFLFISSPPEMSDSAWSPYVKLFNELKYCYSRLESIDKNTPIFQNFFEKFSVIW